MDREGMEIRKGDILALDEDENGREEYVVKKGDTLWDISLDKLGDNFLWPKLWKFNPQVKNPDLIFPGDILIIPSEEDLRRMMKPVAKKVPPPPPVEGPVIEVPEEIPPKPLIDKRLYTSIGWIAPDYPAIGEILEDPEGRTIFGDRDIVYVVTDKPMAAGDKLFAIRKVKMVKHPRTGKKLGLQIRVTGTIEVTGEEGGFVEAKVNETFYEEVASGDGVIPYRDSDPPVVPEEVRTPSIDGYIVESHWNRVATSAGDVVFLDKGSDDGLEPGDKFTVFSDESISRRVGTIQVVSLGPTTSAALIKKSKREIVLGYSWGNR
jgi:hypothetical protein